MERKWVFEIEMLFESYIENDGKIPIHDRLDLVDKLESDYHQRIFQEESLARRDKGLNRPPEIDTLYDAIISYMEYYFSKLSRLVREKNAPKDDEGNWIVDDIMPKDDDYLVNCCLIWKRLIDDYYKQQATKLTEIGKQAEAAAEARISPDTPFNYQEQLANISDWEPKEKTGLFMRGYEWNTSRHDKNGDDIAKVLGNCIKDGVSSGTIKIAFRKCAPDIIASGKNTQWLLTCFKIYADNWIIKKYAKEYKDEAFRRLKSIRPALRYAHGMQNKQQIAELNEILAFKK